MLKKWNGSIKRRQLRQLMDDVVHGKVDDDYINALPVELRDVASAFRRLHSCMVDQFLCDHSLKTSTCPIWDEENERYL